jgi:prepilin-type N-terminal cleavage/methylation domain-containing protein
MNRQKGFTLIELMVSIAIVGILFATAIPAYNAYRERAVGAEAAIMIKQIMDAQIAYYLEWETFYPAPDQELWVYHDTVPGDLEYANIGKIKKWLNIEIKPGRLLNYHFFHDSNSGNPIFRLTVFSQGNFSLAGGSAMVSYELDESGKVSDPTGF